MSAPPAPRPGLLVDAVLLCYPRAWRRRYASEVLSLAAVLQSDGDGRVRTAFDLLRAAPSAWTRRLGSGAHIFSQKHACPFLHGRTVSP